jgi:flagellar protein FliS
MVYPVTANAYANYKQSSIETTPPEKLLLMLFDGGIKFIYHAKMAIERGDFDTAHHNLVKVQDILTELIVSLDMEKGGDIAINLRSLYAFYLNEIVEANLSKNVQKLGPVMDFFREFRTVWEQASLLAKKAGR